VRRFALRCALLTLMLVLVLASLSPAFANEVLDAIDAGNYLLAKELFETKIIGNIYLEAEVFEGLELRI
jgi:hypothetical protein